MKIDSVVYIFWTLNAVCEGSQGTRPCVPVTGLGNLLSFNKQKNGNERYTNTKQDYLVILHILHLNKQSFV